MKKSKGSVGTSMGVIIDIRREREEWMSKGKANCSKCKWLVFGYYCNKKKKSALDVYKPKHCRFYIKK